MLLSLRRQVLKKKSVAPALTLMLLFSYLHIRGLVQKDDQHVYSYNLWVGLCASSAENNITGVTELVTELANSVHRYSVSRYTHFVICLA